MPCEPTLDVEVAQAIEDQVVLFGHQVRVCEQEVGQLGVLEVARLVVRKRELRILVVPSILYVCMYIFLYVCIILYMYVCMYLCM